MKGGGGRLAHEGEHLEALPGAAPGDSPDPLQQRRARGGFGKRVPDVR